MSNHGHITWEEIRIGDLGHIVAGGTPSRSEPSFWNGDIPWVTPGEIRKLSGKLVTSTRESISSAGLSSSAANLLPIGSVLVTTRATLGEMAIAAIPVATNQGFKSIVPNAETDSLFAYYLIGMHRQDMVRLASGTTFLEISKADFERIAVHRPGLAEQRRIAAVLDLLDEAIAKTEAVIAKLRSIRAGLLHDLLTRGLDSGGQLRDPLRHPEQFKPSPLGPIPKEWEPNTIGVVLREVGGRLQTGPFGSQLHAHEYTDDGVPVIMPQDITDGQTLTDQIAHIHEAKAREMQRHRVAVGDIILSRRGDLSRATAITQQQVGWVCGTGCFLIRFPAEQINADWLAEVYRYVYVQKQIGQRTVGTTMPSLNNAIIEGLEVAWPTKEEQDAIIDRLRTLNNRIACETVAHSKLQQLQVGLMSDLLSGNVRVPQDSPHPGPETHETEVV